MALPLAQRCARFVNVPQVYEFTLSGHGDLLNALPLDLESLEARVDLAVVEAGYLVAGLARAVPDVDLTHDAARGDQVVSFIAELRLHQILVKVLCSHDLDVSIAINLPDAGDHV